MLFMTALSMAPIITGAELRLTHRAAHHPALLLPRATHRTPATAVQQLLRAGRGRRRVKHRPQTPIASVIFFHGQLTQRFNGFQVVPEWVFSRCDINLPRSHPQSPRSLTVAPCSLRSRILRRYRAVRTELSDSSAMRAGRARLELAFVLQRGTPTDVRSLWPRQRAFRSSVDDPAPAVERLVRCVQLVRLRGQPHHGRQHHCHGRLRRVWVNLFDGPCAAVCGVSLSRVRVPLRGQHGSR